MKTEKQLSLEIPPEFKQRIQDMGGSNIQLVIQKKLEESEVNKEKSRLSFPIKNIMTDFLNPEETKQLSDKKGLGILLLQPSLQFCTVFFNRWRSFYSLTTNWNVVIKKNEDVIKKDAVVQLWSFRVKSELYFALVKVDDHEEEERERSDDHEAERSDDHEERSDGVTAAALSRKRKEREAKDEILDKAGYLAYMYLTRGTLRGLNVAY